MHRLLLAWNERQIGCLLWHITSIAGIGRHGHCRSVTAPPCDLGKPPTNRSARSRAVAALPIEARVKLQHHSGMAKQQAQVRRSRRANSGVAAEAAASRSAIFATNGRLGRVGAAIVPKICAARSPRRGGPGGARCGSDQSPPCLRLRDQIRTKASLPSSPNRLA
jgi:hypothetical protein